jgi:hypothetical protein
MIFFSCPRHKGRQRYKTHLGCHAIVQPTTSQEVIIDVSEWQFIHFHDGLSLIHRMHPQDGTRLIRLHVQ